MKHISKLGLIFLITIMTFSFITPTIVQADQNMLDATVADLSGPTNAVDPFVTSSIGTIINSDAQGVIDRLLELFGEFFRVISDFFGLISDLFSSSN